MAEPYDTLLPLLDDILDRGGRASNYDEAARRAAIDVALEAFERECNQRFFPRAVRESIVLRARARTLVLDDCDMTAVRSIDGPDGAVDVTTITILDDELVRDASWPAGVYAVEYTCGLATCPDDAAHAVAVLAGSLLKDGPFDDRGYAVVDEGGYARLLTAGIGGASFSIPEVQAALIRHRNPYAGSS